MPTLANPEPQRVTAGDSLAWRMTLNDYPAGEGWALSYTLLNALGKITFTGSADGDEHVIAVTSATTAPWTPGKYRWFRAVAKAGERVTLADGEIEILADPATTAALDTRTHARKTLDALEAWIEARSPAVASYRIGDRQMQHVPIGELLQLRDRYRAEVRAETLASRGHRFNKLQVRL